MYSLFHSHFPHEARRATLRVLKTGHEQYMLLTAGVPGSTKDKNKNTRSIRSKLTSTERAIHLELFKNATS